METTHEPHGTDQAEQVPSLPMRDGNFALVMNITESNQVPSLPMRDGNPGSDPPKRRSHSGSEPTYEGWKLRVGEGIPVSGVGSEPTYEGWKP